MSIISHQFETFLPSQLTRGSIAIYNGRIQRSEVANSFFMARKLKKICCFNTETAKKKSYNPFSTEYLDKFYKRKDKEISKSQTLQKAANGNYRYEPHCNFWLKK